MNQTIRRAVLLAFAVCAPAAAQSSMESLSASAGERFEALTFAAASAGFRPAAFSARPRLDEPGAAEVAGELRQSASVLSADSQEDFFSAQSAELDLPSLLNRHLKTSMAYRLSGRTVWFSAAFDASQNAYLSVLVDGAVPVYYNVRALLNNEEHLRIGGVAYTLSLSPNIFHKSKSVLTLKNDANENEAAHFTVSDMFDAVISAGLPLSLSGQAYRFYYHDGVDGRRMFVFEIGAIKEFHAYLIPEDQVPAGAMGVFTLSGGARVGLTRRGSKLVVYENP
ncbi:MAG: hypothetical protein ACHQ49_13185 [Elusimicrobiota bacterium]